MDAVLQSLLTGFPYYLLHSATALAMLAAGVAIYTLITPYSEWRLVRDGDTAAAVSLSGAVIGLALPIAFTLAFSVSVLDIVIWGGVALVMQLVAYAVVWLLLRELPRRIKEGELGAAILLAAVEVAVAAINAAAIVG